MSLCAAILEIDDGISLRAMLPEDADRLAQLSGAPGNAGILPAPLDAGSAPSFVEQQRGALWSLPMICERDGQSVGALLSPMTNLGSLNALVLAFFEDLRRDRYALALYVRHLFWSYPLRRLYTQVPASAQPYADAYTCAGFHHEGDLAEHRIVGGAWEHIGMYRLLRAEFDQWAATYAPGLLLPIDE